VHPAAYVGPDVEVGPDSVILPGAVLLGRVRVGARVKVGPGAVVGCAGFGYEKGESGLKQLEHDGLVVIDDDVDIGANCTIARAKTGRETRIGRGTKIDCLVHIGHNVTIGCDCIVVAQTGIAGSAVIGDRVVLAGQAGVSDHVSIGDDSIIYAKSAVFRSVPPGSRYSGIPARPHGPAKRFWARLWRKYGRSD
jgi:UDP-3-O-[3-hydroxymyristoyl] glucosamine N-acyltransferase